MNEPVWLLIESVKAVHKMLIAEHGGIAEIRDVGLLDSALNRPRNKFAYEPDVTVFDLAAAYAFGIARNHPFMDGNKRVAFTAIAMFFAPNGLLFRPDRMEALKMMLRLAAGEVEEAELAHWIAANTAPRPGPKSGSRPKP